MDPEKPTGRNYSYIVFYPGDDELFFSELCLVLTHGLNVFSVRVPDVESFRRSLLEAGCEIRKENPLDVALE